MKRYVFMTFGYPGSGKSFAAKWLAKKFNAVHLKVDDLRFTMFNGDRPELYTLENKMLVNNAVDYVYRQIVKTRTVSIILDGNFNQRKKRQDIALVARKNNALPIVLWVKTPEATAEQRIKHRAETEGHVIFDPNIIQNMLKRMQTPDEHEHLITIDGLLSEEEQQREFDKQLAVLESTVQSRRSE